ncbi:hypothetical protein ACLOJK_023694 [Asimina triloba]
MGHSAAHGGPASISFKQQVSPWSIKVAAMAAALPQTKSPSIDHLLPQPSISISLKLLVRTWVPLKMASMAANVHGSSSSPDKHHAHQATNGRGNSEREIREGSGDIRQQVRAEAGRDNPPLHMGGLRIRRWKREREDRLQKICLCTGADQASNGEDPSSMPMSLA